MPSATMTPEEIRDDLLHRLQCVMDFTDVFCELEEKGYWPNEGWHDHCCGMLRDYYRYFVNLQSEKLVADFPQLDAWVRACEERIPCVGHC